MSEARETWRQELRRMERVVRHLERLSPASIVYLRSLLNNEWDLIGRRTEGNTR